MLGKLIGAIAGKSIARQIGGIEGPGGALLGVAATMVLRRLGPAGLITAAVGGYVLKKYYRKRAGLADSGKHHPGKQLSGRGESGVEDR